MRHIPVFFTKEMVASSGSFSPSARKPEAVVVSWAQRFPVDFRKPKPLTEKQIAVAHDPAYVMRVLACAEINGFGNKSREVARSLPFTTGAMYAACEEATRNGLVAAAPVSGFHHAGYGSGGGFCTFNGLMIAALLWQARHGGKAVGILDFDAHYGNGTDDILRTGLGPGIHHWTFGGAYYDNPWEDTRIGKSNIRAARLVEQIPGIIRSWKDRGVKLIIYQAGADPHEDDPLGGYLTSEQLSRRDRLVFQTAKECGIPVAWNLAGGYATVPGRTFQERLRPVLDVHDETMRVCCEVYLSHARAILEKGGQERSRTGQH